MKHPKMEYKGRDSRGDSLYYCPKCGYGGSYMGIVREEDTPICYKKQCESNKEL